MMQLAQIIPDMLLLTGLAGASAFLLVMARTRLAPDSGQVVDAVNRLLPQTQCAQCGYPGCRPYAEAIIHGEAINLCPPGGSETVEQLSGLLSRPPEPMESEKPPAVLARIREAECIGCTLCIAACPVDAIIGAPQLMHTVIDEHCTGCELCLEPCPVDCIDLVPFEIKEESFEPPVEQPCINCGFCEEVCPRDLRPQVLFEVRDDSTRLASNNLQACIECRRCDQVCPSVIPLTAAFIDARKRIGNEQRAATELAKNESRFEARQQRIAGIKSVTVSKPSDADRQSILNSIRTGQ